MKATNSEAKIKVQLLNCQTNLSPCLRNNVGTKEIPKKAKVNIAIQINPNFFIVAVDLFIIPIYLSIYFCKGR